MKTGVLKGDAGLRQGQLVKASSICFMPLLPNQQPQADQAAFRNNTSHFAIFIWHNGPICLSFTYGPVSVEPSNHWKLSGCCMCSFHYRGEEKDLGHYNSVPSMNLNDSDRIFGEHGMYCMLLMVWERTLGWASKCRNIGANFLPGYFLKGTERKRSTIPDDRDTWRRFCR